MASEWKTDAASVRAVLADKQGSSPLVSTDRLRALGYVQPALDASDLAERQAAMDAKLIRVAPLPIDRVS